MPKSMKEQKKLNEPLLIAARDGEILVIAEAIKNGADVNARNEYRWTALMLAATNGHHECVKFLIDRGANVNDRQSAALREAAINGNLECLDILLRSGADVNATEYDGDTCLMYGVHSGSEEVVKRLLDYHANIHAENKDGKTAIDIAKEQKNKKIVNLFVDEYQKKSVENQLLVSNICENSPFECDLVF